MSDRPFWHRTPREAISNVKTERIQVAEAEFVVTHPSDLDELLELEATQSAFSQDEYLPYWGMLWPASIMLAQFILGYRWNQGALPGDAIELGCGVGLPGLAAMRRGITVLLSDYDETSCEFAASNAVANGFAAPEHFTTRCIDWRHVPSDLATDLLLMSDVTYESRHIEPVVEASKKLLRPAGRCFLADPNRSYQQQLIEACRRADFDVRQHACSCQVNSRCVEGTIFELIADSA